MTRIVLTTESGADLPDSLARKHGIYVVPMHVIMEGQDYLDGQLPVEDIYAYYDRTKKIPSTSATNVHEYQEFFKKIRTDFPDCTIVHIGYTSKASVSFQNAVLATEDMEDIHLLDALNVTGGLTAIVMYAVALLENEPMLEPVQFLEKIEAVIPKTRLAFLPGSLDFLRAGGRVSNMAYLGGALLKIKPCIELVEGKLMSTKKYRGNMNKVAEILFHDYLQQYTIDKQQIYFMYSIGLSETIKQRIDEIAKDNGFENRVWIEAGAMISTHSGPGGFGIAGIEC
ncbi:DegV family EDD domain-containing protein [Sporosarcina sp. PTS2304]|uniref:DegV family protein n=1 Tax=Sporosarcina sp. PTS2304 TaxID=2283194 RepID=UPI000E0D0883|nr:DegV family protein [Sporosarcina sp. PTS2304]AXH99782.1 DegV family EDD domain-containing protein [Sporosarcina sp. PTS2304]